MPETTDNAQSFLDFIDMDIDDPKLDPWDGRTNRIDPGTYDFEVIGADMGSSRRGNRTLVLTVEVISEGEMQGRSMKSSYAILPDNEWARRRMKNLIMALGAETERGKFSPASLVGLRMIADVVESEWDDTDGRTGAPIRKTSYKLEGEAPLEEPAPVVQPPPPQNRAPVAQRRSGNNQGRPMRR